MLRSNLLVTLSQIQFGSQVITIHLSVSRFCGTSSSHKILGVLGMVGMVCSLWDLWDGSWSCTTPSSAASSLEHLMNNKDPTKVVFDSTFIFSYIYWSFISFTSFFMRPKKRLEKHESALLDIRNKWCEVPVTLSCRQSDAAAVKRVWAHSSAFPVLAAQEEQQHWHMFREELWHSGHSAHGKHLRAEQQS